MSTQLRAAILTALVALVFVALELALEVQTGMAGIFVFGMAAGFWISDRMVKESAPATPTLQP